MHACDESDAGVSPEATNGRTMPYDQRNAELCPTEKGCVYLYNTFKHVETERLAVSCRAPSQAARV